MGNNIWADCQKCRRICGQTSNLFLWINHVNSISAYDYRRNSLFSGGNLRSVISKDVILEQFASDRFLEVFGFNLYLLLFALLFLLLGAFVETFVLENVTIYQDIIQMSFQAIGG